MSLIERLKANIQAREDTNTESHDQALPESSSGSPRRRISGRNGSVSVIKAEDAGLHLQAALARIMDELRQQTAGCRVEPNRSFPT